MIGLVSYHSKRVLLNPKKNAEDKEWATGFSETLEAICQKKH